jgi:hypothetical protein
MMTAFDRTERRAIAVVAALTLLSLGMLGVILPSPSATADRAAEGVTPYSAAHSAIPDSAAQELPAQF